MESPHRSIHPLRVRRAAVLAGLAVAICCGANNASAQSTSDATRVARAANGTGTNRGDAPSTWSDRLRGAVHDKLAPIYKSFADLLRPVASNVTWGGPVHFDGVVPVADSGQPKFTRAFAAGESHDYGAAENSFSPLTLNPRYFRMPWLVAPSNLFHAMPIMPLEKIGPVQVNFVAASLGVNSGTSAALMQFTVRF